MKHFTHFLMVVCLVCALSSAGIIAAEEASSRRTFAPDNIIIKPNLTSIPHVWTTARSLRIQSASEYRVIDSLFNAFSFYGSEQQPICYEPQTGLFSIVKRGANPPGTAGTDNSNSLRILVSKDLGKTWLKPFSVYSGDATKAGLPRYPCIDISIQEGASNVDDAVFCFFAPLTKSTGTGTTKQRAWDGSAIGYQANDLSTPSAFDEYGTEAEINGAKFYWGTDCTPLTFRTKADDALYASYAVDLSPSDSAVTNPADVNSVGVFRKDFYQSNRPTLTVPESMSSAKFRAVTAASTVTRTHVGMGRDSKGNFYNANFGFFTAADNIDARSFGVSKSTDHGATWGEFNIMPHTVFVSYANSINCNPDSVFFDWRRSSTNAAAEIRLTNYTIVVTGVDKFSCFTQLYSFASQPVGTHLVECYYENGQWGMRKVADLSLFENADFWRQFDTDGTPGPSQMGNELQAAVTADGSTIVCKFLEAKVLRFKNENGDQDSTLTTDVVVTSRGASDSKWSLVKNVTQSDITDRTTWMPTVLPNSLTNIPLVTIQTKDKGTTPIEQIYSNQMRLAHSTADRFEEYKQYLTISNFNLSDLPLWNGLTQVDVKDQENTLVNMMISPNPAQNQLTVSFNSSLGVCALNIVNALGEVVLSESFNSTVSGTEFRTINTESLSVGSYVLTLKTTSGYTSQSLRVVR